MDISNITQFMTEDYDNCLIEIFPFIHTDSDFTGKYTIEKNIYNKIVKGFEQYTSVKCTKNIYTYRDTELSIINHNNQLIIGKTQLASKICSNLIIVSSETILKLENIPLINNYHAEVCEDILIYNVNNINIELSMHGEKYVVKIHFVFNVKNKMDIENDLVKVNKILLR